MAGQSKRKSSNPQAFRARTRGYTPGTRGRASRNATTRLKSGLGFVALAAMMGVYALTNFAPAVQGPFDLTASPAIVGGASIIDGDTLDVQGQRIRLYGIDAPEGRQVCQGADGLDYLCGELATRALADKIGGHTVSCDRRDVDRYGRIVGVCQAGSEDLNGWLVSEGWAVAYRRYSTDYVSAEEAARTAKRGIWVGKFTPPEEWRQAQRASAETRQPEAKQSAAACNIKGNISANGRIYHMPGGQYYDRTRIDTSRGERWFCTEAEAQTAGWRRSKL